MVVSPLIPPEKVLLPVKTFVPERVGKLVVNIPEEVIAEVPFPCRRAPEVSVLAPVPPLATNKGVIKTGAVLNVFVPVNV